MSYKTFRNFLVLFSVVLNLSAMWSTAETNEADARDYYNEVVEQWPKIFPDGNRNAGGAVFFKYFLDNVSSYRDFMEFSKLYCPVSGSLVLPNSVPDFIAVKSVGTNNLTCGDLYKCCWPCSCDISKYAEFLEISHEFEEGTKKFIALVIDNPCEKIDFPLEVERSYFCSGKDINTERVFAAENKIAIGVLHDAAFCSLENLQKIASNQVTGKQCDYRNSIPKDRLDFGMGDIFINLAD